MKWLKKILARWVDEGNDDIWGLGGKFGELDKIDHSSEFSLGEPMNITIYNITGGKVVKFHSYHRRKGENSETAYIVLPSEDLAEALAKFITLETLKNADK